MPSTRRCHRYMGNPINILGLLLLTVLTSMAATSLFWRQQLLPRHLHAKDVPITPKHCGNTPAEARARGCRFEVHDMAWVPAACYDAELEDNTDAFAVWAADSEGSRFYDKAEVMQGTLPYVFVPTKHHYAHCSLTWKKYQRAVMFGWPMDNFTASYGELLHEIIFYLMSYNQVDLLLKGHKSHCAERVLGWDSDPTFLGTKVVLKFPECDYRWRDAPLDGDHQK
ncbi:hypothetical protein MPH_13617 [Macrophomina phaseolina MS6]|uniref:Uncharacterized protein n=1 Tax=Macrophomina phaseolina (strain MS6) TaxID=1126212 RepID=K2QHS7_MACPH|nr:hypothetical protein MPH_13617 [Macrophomina phaseolina MS6]